MNVFSSSVFLSLIFRHVGLGLWAHGVGRALDLVVVVVMTSPSGTGGQRGAEEMRNSTRLWIWRDPSLPRGSWQPFINWGTTQGWLSLPRTDVLSTIVKQSTLTMTTNCRPSQGKNNIMKLELPVFSVSTRRTATRSCRARKRSDPDNIGVADIFLDNLDMLTHH